MIPTNIYDKLKFIALVILPALATLVVAVNPLWDIPNQDAIAGSIMGVDTFLGALLIHSSKKHRNVPVEVDGYLDSSGEHPDTGLLNLQMTITATPDELLGKDYVRLKVGPAPVQRV